jgi:hypothetical protein
VDLIQALTPTEKAIHYFMHQFLWNNFQLHFLMRQPRALPGPFWLAFTLDVNLSVQDLVGLLARQCIRRSYAQVKDQLSIPLQHHHDIRVVPELLHDWALHLMKEAARNVSACKLS